MPVLVTVRSKEYKFNIEQNLTKRRCA